MMSERYSKYFDISDAVDDIKYSYGAKDTALSTLKLLSKGVYNVGCFAVTEVLPSVAEKVKQQVEAKKASQDDKKLMEDAGHLPEKKIGDQMTSEEFEVFLQKELHDIFEKPMQELEKNKNK